MMYSNSYTGEGGKRGRKRGEGRRREREEGGSKKRRERKGKKRKGEKEKNKKEGLTRDPQSFFFFYNDYLEKMGKMVG